MRISDWSSDVCSSDLAAICPPARPPTVITITDTIWNRACAQARISTWRCMGFLSMSFFALLFYSSTRDGAQALGHGVDLCLRGAAPQAEAHCAHADLLGHAHRSEEHTSELQSIMRISYAVFCLKKKKHRPTIQHDNTAR